MFSRIAIAALAMSAFAAAAMSELAPTGATQSTNKAAVTVIEKNQHWPLKKFMTMSPCKYTACEEV